MQVRVCKRERCTYMLSGSSRFGNNNYQCTLERAGERTLVSCEHIASEKDDRSSLLLLLEIGNKKKKYKIVLIVHSVLTVLFIFLKFCNIFENGQARHDF